MAYQNVGTGKFYINVIEFLGSTGLAISDKFRTLPVNPSFVSSINVPSESTPLLTDPDMEKFIFVLGHNLVSGDQIVMEGGSYDEATINVLPVSYSGFSLLKYTGDLTAITVDGDVGSFVVGNTYTMPHSPDLNLTLTRDYSGIKTIETKGGASLSNSFYSKPPAWGELGSWELGSGNPKISRSGRRIWDLSFSYLSARDVFGSNQSLSEGVWGIITEAQGWDADDIDDTHGTFNKHLLNSDDFYSQVIHKTNGGQLPFIFQPNKDDNTVFAICKFDMKSFKFEQVANGVYNVKLKIREVW